MCPSWPQRGPVSSVLSRRAIVLALSLAAYVVLPSPSYGQTEWLGPDLERAYWVRVLKPDFEDETLLTGSYALGLRYPFESAALIVEVPLAHWGVDRDFFEDRSETALGNPYVGAAWGSGPVEGTVGVRIPLAPDDASRALGVGFASDPIDRQEAFLPDLVPLTGGMRAETRFGESDAWTFAVRTDASLWLSTRGNGGEAFLRLGGEIWYEGPRVVAGAGAVAKALATGNAGSISQLGGSLDVKLGDGWRPGVEFRLPLHGGFRDDTNDYTIGVHLVLER